VGHGRGAVFGDALANLLAFTGYKVTREYYINDAGAQVDVLARSAYLRYREALGEHITIPEGLYPGEYLKSVGKDLAQADGPSLKDRPEAEWLPIVRKRAIDMMMAEIRNDLRALGIVQDEFFSERSLIGKGADRVAETINWLKGKGHVYEGRLPPPKSGAVEDWEDREQTLFRSTAFGDDVDRPLKKSDGSYTYFATDIAYHKSKLDRGFRDLIDVWGADHGGYVKRMQAAVKALSGAKADLDVKLVQLVRLLRAGEPVKMSKRAGEFVTLREVVDEVGRDAVRFDMLYRKNDAVLDFDLAKVIEHSRENPVFYVQYAHARTCSVGRNAAEAGVRREDGFDAFWDGLAPKLFAADASPDMVARAREIAAGQPVESLVASVEAMRDRFGAKSDRSWKLRFHSQTAGVSLTAQQPLNNIVRTTTEALSAILGGTQSLHTNSFDEALALPTEEAVRVALRTQQIIAHETGVTSTIDPLGGSYFIESLTDGDKAARAGR